jgi:tRNA threonylcarbamoyladenosine biosynthesis protein TsaB
MTGSILALRTDGLETEIYLLDDGEVVAQKKWLAERRLADELLSKIEKLVDGQWDKLDGLVVFVGPGSFTGLRIGIATMNSLSYAQNIPIVGASGTDWLEKGLKRLESGENDRIVIPNYGAEANITKPKTQIA